MGQFIAEIWSFTASSYLLALLVRLLVEYRELDLITELWDNNSN